MDGHRNSRARRYPAALGLAPAPPGEDNGGRELSGQRIRLSTGSFTRAGRRIRTRRAGRGHGVFPANWAVVSDGGGRLAHAATGFGHQHNRRARVLERDLTRQGQRGIPGSRRAGLGVMAVVGLVSVLAAAFSSSPAPRGAGQHQQAAGSPSAPPPAQVTITPADRSEEHTSELQSPLNKSYA